MRLTIVKPDNAVGIDGEFMEVDLSSLPDTLHAVQWNETYGFEELTDGSNIEITSISKYDSIITAWDTAKATSIERQDPFYGLTLDEAKEKVKISILSYGAKKDIEPFEFPVESGIYYKSSDAVLNTLNYCSILGLSDSDPIPVNNGKWDNYDASSTTDFTVGDLKNLFKIGYGIPAHNYTNVKTHIYSMMQLTTVEAVKNYDYSGGWYGV